MTFDRFPFLRHNPCPPAKPYKSEYEARIRAALKKQQGK